MDLTNKTFTSNIDGASVKVTKMIDGNIAELDGGNRVLAARLLDKSFFTENIDPNTFFNRDSTIYENFINKIKTTPDNITDNRDTGSTIKESGIFENAPPKNEFYNNEPVPTYYDDPEAE